MERKGGRGARGPGISLYQRSMCWKLVLAAGTGIRYKRRVQYEWDTGKATQNLRKHGVDFVDAIAALEDSNRLEELDEQLVYDEERTQVIGMARSDVLLSWEFPRLCRGGSRSSTYTAVVDRGNA
jgi:uncharacterized DUF497 family protein